MNLRKIVREVLDSLKNVITMDGGPLGGTGNGGGWLEAHDRQYHGGHYEEGQQCKLREKLNQADDADRLQNADGGGNAASILERAPTLAQFTSLMNRLLDNNSLTTDQFAEVGRLLSETVRGMSEANDENFEMTPGLAQNLRALSELYHSLDEAFPVNGDAPAAQPSQEERPVVPTDEQIQAAIDRVSGQVGGHRGEVEAAIRSALRDGSAGHEAQFNQFRQLVGENDPVVMAIAARDAERAAQSQNVQPRNPSGEENVRVNDQNGNQQRFMNVARRGTTGSIIDRVVDRTPNTINRNIRRGIANATSIPLRDVMTRDGLQRGVRMLLQNAANDSEMTSRTRDVLRLMEQRAVQHPSGFSAAVISAVNRLNPRWRDDNIERQATVSPRISSPYQNQNIDISHETTDININNARSVGLGDTYVGGDLGFFPINFHRLGIGCNCWKSAAASLLRKRGFNVIARGDNDNSCGGSQRDEFFMSQTACYEAYENIGGMSKDETRVKLQSILDDDSAYPNGTAILCWSGGHGTIAIKKGRTFEFCDSWDGSSTATISPSHLLGEYSLPGHLGRSRAINYRRDNTDVIAAKEAYQYYLNNKDLIRKVGIAMNKPESERTRGDRSLLSRSIYILNKTFPLTAVRPYVAMWQSSKRDLSSRLGRAPTDSEIETDVGTNRNSPYWRFNGTWVVKPNDPLIPELFKLSKKFLI